MRARSEDLLNLPELEPPAAARARVLAAMQAAARASAPRARTRLVRLCAAAALAGIAVTLALRPWRVETPGSPIAAPGTSIETSNAALTPTADDYGRLVAESERLERALTELPAQRRIMRADTARTIAGLEDQIAAIDAELTFAAANGLEPEQRTPLWRERVEIMNALVQVRYAQSKAFVF